MSLQKAGNYGRPQSVPQSVEFSPGCTSMGLLDDLKPVSTPGRDPYRGSAVASFLLLSGDALSMHAGQAACRAKLIHSFANSNCQIVAKSIDAKF